MSNYCEHNDDAYSYQTCIRTSFSNETEAYYAFRRVRTIGNVTKYNVTTSRHQNIASVSACDIRLDNIPEGTTAEELRQYAVDYLKEETERLKRTFNLNV